MNYSFLKTSLLGVMVIGLLSLNFTNLSSTSIDVLGVANPFSQGVSFNTSSDYLLQRSSILKPPTLYPSERPKEFAQLDINNDLNLDNLALSQLD